MEKKIQKSRNFGMEVTIKGLIIVGMIILLLIPVFLLQGKVREREERKDEAVTAIADKWSRAQTICGPVLTVPFVKLVEDQLRKGRREVVTTLVSFTPETLDVKASLAPETRRYGMYEAILYTSDVRLSGNFSPEVYVEALRYGTPDLARATLTMELSDLRGLSNQLVFSFDGREYEVEAGGNRENYDGPAGYYSASQLVVKPQLENPAESMTFECTMSLRGSEGLHFVPVGRTTTVELDGVWSHPSFTGNFSPEHNVNGDTDDFTAKWTVLNYNRDIPDRWEGGIEELTPTKFGVELVTGADEYQQNERAVKYALLFVVLTFVVFFFVEVLTFKRIHPIQYLLVAAALMIFYTLLLSISEIIGFGPAYLVSAIATVGLIMFYTAYIFKNVRETALLSGILAGLYAYLYFILQMENYTLLVGSVGLFVILGVVMYVSRKVSWYRAEEN
jgi:inner membrane protein